MTQKNYMKKVLVLCSVFVLFFLSCSINLSAEEIDWIEVANTNNQIQFIDANSIKYNKRGLLSVITKYSEISPDDQEIINTNEYLIAVDCENRLFSKLPANGELNQIKNWEEPTNDKLIKNTIINSCAY
tara:strand:+ start:456 stop:842 length:387 start_codon:yes stop_codon:yes gene_type:complete